MSDIRSDQAQGATFVELFFDLVFVFAVTQVTGVLAHDLTAAGLLNAAVVFWLVWWAWTQYTWSLNEADTEHRQVRLMVLVATGLAFLLALSVPAVATAEGWLFPASYLLLRSGGIWLQWRLASGDREWTGAVKRWTVVSGIGLTAIAVAVFVPPDWRLLVLGAAALLDVTAALQAAGAGEWRLFPTHFAERHGLFVIIALGESLIAAGMGASSRPLSGAAAAVILASLVAVSGLWWSYFAWVKDSLEERMHHQSPTQIGRYARNIYSFSHFLIVGGVIGLAVGVEESLAHPDQPLTLAASAALAVGAVAFLGGTGLALDLAGLSFPLLRLVVAAILVASVAPLTAVPAWLALSLVAVMAVLVAVFERGPAPRLVPETAPE